MKKSTQIFLSIVCVLLLFVSFPVRDVWGNNILSDACRLVGFVLLLILATVRLMKKKN